MSECNCKKTAKKVQKYTDDETIIKLKGIRKVLNMVKILIIFVLVFLLFIVSAPFVCMYLIIQHIRGLELKLNVTKLIRIFYVKPK